MKTSEFRGFKQTVATANEDSDIWSFAFLWVNLTDKQVKQIGDIIQNKPYIELVKRNDDETEWYKFPNGIMLRKY